MDIPKDYLIADGPDRLEQILDSLLEKSKNDSIFALQDHYVLYQLGAQQSLMKVDTSKVPFKFWYYDLLGRPPTAVVKNIIAKFLWERCGVKEMHLKEGKL